MLSLFNNLIISKLELYFEFYTRNILKIASNYNLKNQ